MALKHFTVDARALITLGRESIKDHITALLELVKNSYDADATRVDVQIRSDLLESYIRVADDGVGMSDAELESNWLRIGYSAKREVVETGRSRRATGEKGIGRLSADRLGQLLEIRSKANKARAVGLAVEWSRFEASGRDLHEIPVDVLEDCSPRLPSGAQGRTGTELIIRELRQSWRKRDLIELYGELSVFAPPLTAIPDFRIRLDAADPEVDGVIKSSFEAEAEIEVDLGLRKNNSISYKVFGRTKAGKRRKITEKRMRWDQLTQHPQRPDSDSDRKPVLGPARARLFFYPRKAETVRGTDFTLKDLRSFLNRHAGIRIYRDKIRVRPYGSPTAPEGDWLDLGGRKVTEPAGPARSTFRIAPNQIVGAVFVGRDTNPDLADSSGREGLVNNEAFEDLRRFVLGGVILLEHHYHQSFKEAAKSSTNEIESPRQIAAEIKQAASALRKVKRAAESGSAETLDRSLGELPSVLDKLARAQRSADEFASQATVLRGLATVGIAGVVFGHETQTSVAQLSSSTQTALRLLNRQPPRNSDAIEEIESALDHSRRVAAWGAFALARVRKDKRTRRKLDIDEIANNICDTLEPPFLTSSIDLDRRIRAVSGRTFAMDIESILVNLLTNAYTATQQMGRKRRVRVTVAPKKSDGRPGVLLAVADSGTGVAAEYRDRIWEPLFSTKVGKAGGGTGLGLAIVQSIVDEHGGTRSVRRNQELRGAHFEVWLPLG